MIQLLYQAFFHHLGNHIFTGNSNVVGCAALLHFRIHGFIGVKGIVLDLDTSFLSKLSQQLRIDIVTPVVNDQLIALLALRPTFNLVTDTPQNYDNQQNPR